MKKQVGVEPELIEGSGGVFDVDADGQRIFCRREADRFPTEEEIVDALRQLA